MTSVYSVQFVALAELTGSHGLDVPAGYKYILRDVDVVNRSGSAVAFGLVGSAGQFVWYWDPLYNANALGGQWRGRQVFNPGEQIVFNALSGAWDVTASGYALTLP